MNREGDDLFVSFTSFSPLDTELFVNMHFNYFSPRNLVGDPPVTFCVPPPLILSIFSSLG